MTKKATVPKATNPPPSGIRATGGTASINPEDDANTSTEGDLATVVKYATQMISLEDQMTTLQERLAELGAQHFQIQYEQLPSFMEGIGLKEFSLSNGNKLVVTPVIRGSIPSESAIEKEKDADERATKQDRFERCLAYLKKHGAEAIIKNFVEAELGKDSLPLAKKAIAALKKLGVPAHLSRGVHSQTLNSWIRERIEIGADVDMDLFQVFCGKKAEIKQPKGSKPAKGAKASFI